MTTWSSLLLGSILDTPQTLFILSIEYSTPVTQEPRSRLHPGSAQNDLSSQRVPFSYRVSFRPGTHLTFGSGSLVAAYFNAIEHHISDVARIGDIPKPTDPLKERAKYVIRSLKMLQSAHKCNNSCAKECRLHFYSFHECNESCRKQCVLSETFAWDRPKLITPTWVEEVSRILRRATTDGGSDEGLVDYMLFSITAEARPGCGDSVDDTEWAIDWRQVLHGLCMFSRESIEIAWKERLVSQNVQRERALEYLQNSPSLFRGLSDMPAESWLHGLSDMISELLTLLTMSRRLINLPSLVLEFGPHHPLWHETCEVQGH